MHAAQSSSIVSGVNETRFLEHVRTLFSTSDTLLAEALQNARRAGATLVEFTHDLDTLVVSDNGSGVADFRSLITLAETGWSQDLIQSERPFGIGFFSISFSAAQVTVESRGRQIVFSSDDLVAKKPIAVTASSFIGGTRITLKGCSLKPEKIESSLKRYARGFAIPVVWQGAELPRPHAMSRLSGCQTPAGFISIPGIHREGAMQVGRIGIAYCQGLPVRVHGFSHSNENREGPIIHIDHHRYQPRMPDRDSLIDSEAAAKEFDLEIDGIWGNFLSAQKQVLSSEEFSERFWAVSRQIHAQSIMNDVPVLPTSALSYVREYPVQLYEGEEDFMAQNSVAVTQAEVESGQVFLCTDAMDYSSGTGVDFAKLLVARDQKWLFVSPLPKGHWARPFVFDLDAAPVKIGGKVLAKDVFDGGYVSGAVKVVDKLVVIVNGVRIELSDPVAMGGNSWSGAMAFLIPAGCEWPSRVLRQASSYVNGNDNDSFQETDHDLDCTKFEDLVSILAGEKSVETMKKCLVAADAEFKTNLRNQSFRVTFDAQGKISVCSA